MLSNKEVIFSNIYFDIIYKSLADFLANDSCGDWYEVFPLTVY
jgi:hypothetical protein